MVLNLEKGRFISDIRKTFFTVGLVRQIGWRNCECSIIRSVQGQVGGGFEQEGLDEKIFESHFQTK